MPAWGSITAAHGSGTGTLGHFAHPADPNGHVSLEMPCGPALQGQGTPDLFGGLLVLVSP